eukprot:1259202-Prymnesium_polylepis.1
MDPKHDPNHNGNRKPQPQTVNPDATPNAGPHRYAYLAKFLVLPEEQSDARMLSLAMDGRGCDEPALIEFLCARHPRRVRAAKAKWEGRNDASL